jgi:DNA/RNA endonuclease G (NUC1)
MKYIISLLVMIWSISEAKAQCNQCDPLFGCVRLEVRNGKSSTINSKNPVNLRELFDIKGRTPELLMNNTTITWWFVDQTGNVRSLSNANASATAYNFKLAEWGKVEVYVTFTCINGTFVQSASTFIEVLDYGIYFYAANSTHAGTLPWKFRTSEASTVSTNFFDRNRPTIIYIPGWNQGSVANKVRERLQDNTGQSMIAYWRNLGWNVGIFHWNQFSDELSPADVEGKLYDNVGPEKLLFGDRKNWRKSDGSLTRDAAPDSGMVKLFLEQYYSVKSTLLGNRKELRLAGHSLGAELMCVSMAQATPAAFLPDRIALLDPWWTLGKQDGYRNALQKLAADSIPIEWYTTTNLQKMTAALENLPSTLISTVRGWTAVKKFFDLAIQQATYQAMLNTAAQVSLRPRFINVDAFDPLAVIKNEHKAAVWWYFSSIQSPLPGLCINPTLQLFDDGNYDMLDDEKKVPLMITDADGISAASCKNDIIEYRGTHFLHTNGTKTLTTADDTLMKNEIVIIGKKPMPFSREKTQQGRGTNTPVSANNPVAPNAPVSERFSPDRMTTPLPVVAGKEVKIDQVGQQQNSPISYYNIYNFDVGYPVATGWHTSRAWRGRFARTAWTNGRSGNQQFPPSKAFNADFAAVMHKDYNCSGFDRGHSAPSNDRNMLEQEMGDTYFMNNMIPMNPKQNQNLIWSRFEHYLAEERVGNTLNSRGKTVGDNQEVFVFAGALQPASNSPTAKGTKNSGLVQDFLENASRVKVPGRLWKVVLIHIPGQPFDRANTNMIAVLFPNRIDAGADWTNYITTVNEIERLTTYNFFDKLDDAVEDDLESTPFNPTTFIALNDQLEAGQNREETACRSMTLSPGFNAAQGSRFRGSINPNCGSVARAAKVTAHTPAATFVALPNPTNGEVTIRFSGINLSAGKTASINLIDMQGRVLLTRSIAVIKGNNQLLLNLAKYTPGTYLVQLQTSDGQLQITKLIKQ